MGTLPSAGYAEMVSSKSLILFNNLRNNTWNLIEITGVLSEDYPVFVGGTGSLNRLILGNHVLWLGRTRSAWLSFTEGHLGGK